MEQVRLFLADLFLTAGTARADHLIQLSEFFLQGHKFQEGIDFRLRDRILRESNCAEEHARKGECPE